MLNEKAFKIKSSHFMKAPKGQNINYSKKQKANKTQIIHVLERLFIWVQISKLVGIIK